MMNRPINCWSRWSVIRHLGGGIYFAIPLCCVLEFCARFLLRPNSPTADIVGCTRKNSCYEDYVHCCWHRKKLHRRQA